MKLNRAAFLLLLGVTIFQSCNRDFGVSRQIDELPAIFPDYKGVAVPPNIAPLNFRVEGECHEIAVRFEGSAGYRFTVRGKGSVEIPGGKWRRLLAESIGAGIKVTVHQYMNKEWVQFVPFVVDVMDAPIDEFLVYRRIAPGYEVYSHMGIYQRDITCFKEKPIIANTLVAGSCVNCHSFNQNSADEMMFHVRGASAGTMLIKSGCIERLHTKTEHTIGNFQYPYWHPSGKYIAYSVNKTAQTFHATDANMVEVFDSKSDIVVYDIGNNSVLTTDLLFSEEWFETWPSFSPVGDHLYFMTAHAQPVPHNYSQVKYSFCRISFDAGTGAFGSVVDTLINAAVTGKSLAFPRISPDGRYVMLTQFDYGNFPIWHKEADLILYDFKSDSYRVMDEINSNDTDSYHSWSSDGRWVVFSSRRVNGLYTMPYIAYIDDGGKARKPFLLPQKRPGYYDNLLYSFNIPELINAPVRINVRELEKAVTRQGRNVSFVSADGAR